MSRSEIQDFIHSIIWTSEEKLEEMTGIQKVIDRVYTHGTKRFFLYQIFIYIVGFVAPFLVSVFSSNVEYTEPSIIVCSITMAILTMIEILDVLKNGRKYFKNAWNFTDMLLIICWYYYFFKRWGNNFGQHEV